MSRRPPMWSKQRGLFLKQEAIQSTVPMVDAPLEMETRRFELLDHHLRANAVSSAVRRNISHAEERRQEPSRREVQDREMTTGPQCLIKACVGLHGSRDMMVDASHQNRIAAAALKTGVDLTSFNH